MMKTLDWKTLRDDGYLQEVNRRFFHPLGLALCITVDGETGVLSILDAREDEEGFKFADTIDLVPKVARVEQLVAARTEARIKRLGYWLQPVMPTANWKDAPSAQIQDTIPTQLPGAEPSPAQTQEEVQESCSKVNNRPSVERS
jgi:hypothetical protein